MLIYNPISIYNDTISTKTHITRSGYEFVDATMVIRKHDNSVEIYRPDSPRPFVLHIDWRIGGIDRDFCLRSSYGLGVRMKRRFVYFTPKHSNYILKL